MESKLIEHIEKTLNPEYMNDVFTWAQIKKAVESLSKSTPTTLERRVTDEELAQFKKIDAAYLEVDRHLMSFITQEDAKNIKLEGNDLAKNTKILIDFLISKQRDFLVRITDDGNWISPIKKESNKQHKDLKKIFGHYPNASPKWQYMNALIAMAFELQENRLSQSPKKGLDLNKLERKLDTALDKETPESIKKWLDKERATQSPVRGEEGNVIVTASDVGSTDYAHKGTVVTSNSENVVDIDSITKDDITNWAKEQADMLGIRPEELRTALICLETGAEWMKLKRKDVCPPPEPPK